MPRLLSSTRFLVIIPIIGLALAASLFFVIGGFQLIKLIIEGLLVGVGFIEPVQHAEEFHFEVEIIEYVHSFLIGTVLYITAIGLYQLFIQEVEFHGWLRIDSTEELETNLIGVTVVVLAVNFLGIVFTADPAVLLEYGAGIALPIAALALFVGLRTWSASVAQAGEKKDNHPSAQSHAGED